MLVIENTLALLRADADDAVLIDTFVRDLLDRNDIGAVAVFTGGFDHLREASGLVLHEHVGQQQGKRLAADQFPGAPNGMAEPQRLLLAGKAGRARVRQFPPQSVERFLLLALEQRHFQFELPVEMILDNPFVPPGDEYEMLDAGFARLVDDMLDQRPVNHRQHFLRHGLCGRQEPSAKPGDGKDGFTNDLHGRQG